MCKLSVSEAKQMLAEAARLNPGPWVRHSEYVAAAAGRIAARCGLDAEKAYTLGLLRWRQRNATITIG